MDAIAAERSISSSRFRSSRSLRSRRNVSLSRSRSRWLLRSRAAAEVEDDVLLVPAALRPLPLVLGGGDTGGVDSRLPVWPGLEGSVFLLLSGLRVLDLLVSRSDNWAIEGFGGAMFDTCGSSIPSVSICSVSIPLLRWFSTSLDCSTSSSPSVLECPSSSSSSVSRCRSMFGLLLKGANCLTK